MNFDKYKKMGAYHYEWYKDKSGEHDWYIEAVDKVTNFCLEGSVLEVGCGDGLVGNILGRAGIPYLGLDSDLTGIELARAKAREYSTSESRFLFMDIADVVRLELSMPHDHLICLNTIEHLENPRVLLDFFTKNTLHSAIIITDIPQEIPSGSHVREFSESELRYLFNQYTATAFKIGENYHGIEVFK